MIILLTATALIFMATLAFGFVYDDHSTVEQNFRLTSSQYIPGYFTHHVWAHEIDVPARYYRPLLLIWFFILRQMFGIAPMYWHAMNVLLHVMVTWLVYRVAQRCLGDSVSALAAAAIFALHPVHVESVAWVSGANDPLLAIAAMSALLCQWRANDPSQRQWVWRLGVAACVISALLVKEIAIFLPIVLLLWPDPEGKWRLWSSFARNPLWSCTLLGMGGAYLAVRHIILGGFASMNSETTWLIALWTVPSLLLRYARLIFVPTSLGLFYDFQPVMSAGLLSFWLPCIFILMLGGLLWIIARWCRLGSVLIRSGIWFLLFLAPALNIRLLNPAEIVHDRYLYIGSIGLAIFLGGVWGVIWRKAQGMQKKLLVAVSLGLALGAALACVNQSLYWSSDAVLYRRALQIDPKAEIAMVNLSNILRDHGDLQGAGMLLEKAVVERPSDYVAWQSLGFIHFLREQYPQAEQAFVRSRSMASTFPNTLYMGLTLMRLGRNAEAGPYLESVVRRYPAQPWGHYWYGQWLLQAGDTPAAAREFNAELALFPDHVSAKAALENISH